MQVCVERYRTEDNNTTHDTQQNKTGTHKHQHPVQHDPDTVAHHPLAHHVRQPPKNLPPKVVHHHETDKEHNVETLPRHRRPQFQMHGHVLVVFRQNLKGFHGLPKTNVFHPDDLQIHVQPQEMHVQADVKPHHEHHETDPKINGRPTSNAVPETKAILLKEVV